MPSSHSEKSAGDSLCILEVALCIRSHPKRPFIGYSVFPDYLSPEKLPFFLDLLSLFAQIELFCFSFLLFGKLELNAV